MLPQANKLKGERERMKTIDWRRVYNGRVLHGFIDEYQEFDNSPRTFPPIVKRRKTLCGKWFALYHNTNDNHYYKKCKGCVANEES